MRICRESLLTKAHGRSCCGRKGASAPFSCLPARTGSGRARKQVKGLVPCGFSGQRPEPSESFLMSRSAIFKVLLSLFFSARFFIDHLTLPKIILYICGHKSLWQQLQQKDIKSQPRPESQNRKTASPSFQLSFQAV